MAATALEVAVTVLEVAVAVLEMAVTVLEIVVMVPAVAATVLEAAVTILETAAMALEMAAVVKEAWEGQEAWSRWGLSQRSLWWHPSTGSSIPSAEKLPLQLWACQLRASKRQNTTYSRQNATTQQMPREMIRTQARIERR